MKSNTRFCFLLLLLVFFNTGCTDRPQTPLRIGAVLWPGYEPLYLANKLGYFKDQPIKIIDYLSNTDAIQAFKNNNLNAAAFTLDETLQILADGIDVDIVLIMDTSNGGDVILANPDIKSMQDLKGKSIAVESSAVGAFVLKRALEINNMTLDDIHIVSTSAMEQLSHFNNGKVVAAVSFDPYRTVLLKAGKKEIFNSTKIPNEIIDVLVVRKSYREENPDIIKTVINSWFKALDYQASKPVASASHSIKRFNNTTEEYIENLKLIKFTTQAENRLLLNNHKSPLLQQQTQMLTILKELGLTDKATSLKGHLNKEFIP